MDHDKDKADRIVACVNAMAGLDPVKVRDLVDALTEEEIVERVDGGMSYDDGYYGAQNYWAEKARACKLEAQA